MGIITLIGIAIGVSMDAFAIAICKGLSVEKLKLKHLLSAGIWFGGGQAIMPLVGYLTGKRFSTLVESFDHWISFGLLVLIGVNMIIESRGEIEQHCASFSPKVMLPLTIAGSIDALAVGVEFAFEKVDVIPAITLIGITTFLFSALGVKIGNRFGAKYKSKAELTGGIILILMGTIILLENTIFA